MKRGVGQPGGIGPRSVTASDQMRIEDDRGDASPGAARSPLRIVYMVSNKCAMSGETGGVLSLVRSYCEAARSLGHDVSLFSLWDNTDWATVDLVHAAPCDVSMLGVARALRERGVRFVVSPIVDKTYWAGALRAVAFGDRLMGGYYRSHLGAAQDILRLSSAVCVMSTDEDLRVRRGLGVVSKPIRVVRPTIHTDAPALADPDDTLPISAGDYVLFVGDLGNERKNVLRLIEACESIRLPLVLVGSLGRSAYGQKVRAALSASGIARYLGAACSAQVVRRTMARCRVFALPSMTEGIGLAALEAGAAGARVVITTYGGTHDYFGECAWYVDPRSARSIAAGLRSAWDAAENAPLAALIKQTCTTAVTAEALDRLYRDALANG
jgi:glycosyltransferase involved in cell wall biosynthesis